MSITFNSTVTATVTFNNLYAESVRINGGGKVTMFQRYQTSQNFGSVAGHATATATFTASGVTANSLLFSGPPDAIADSFVVSASYSADDVVMLSVHNTSNNSQSAPTATFQVLSIGFA